MTAMNANVFSKENFSHDNKKPEAASSIFFLGHFHSKLSTVTKKTE